MRRLVMATGSFLLLVLLAAGLGGCYAKYTVPGGAANMEALGVNAQARAAMTDDSVREALAKKPLATFPARIAVARVQASDYTNYEYDRHGNRQDIRRGAYAVITTPDVEKHEDFELIGKLPQVAGVALIRRVILERDLNSDQELRNAAARLHADLLVFYTFDTNFTTDTVLRPLSVISLGLFPNKNAKVASTASAVLMDVRNGYIYAIVEATAQDHQLANAWSSEDAIDQVRKRVEREAFVKLVAAFQEEWPNVLLEYAPRPGTTAVAK